MIPIFSTIAAIVIVTALLHRLSFPHPRLSAHDPISKAFDRLNGPYRELPEPTGCEECAKRDQRILDMHNLLVRLDDSAFPIQPCPFNDTQSDLPYDTHTVRCPRCTEYAGRFRWHNVLTGYTAITNKAQYRIEHDTGIHVSERRGFLWLKRCSSTPHRHRRCQHCDFEWIERARPFGWVAPEEKTRKPELRAVSTLPVLDNRGRKGVG